MEWGCGLDSTGSGQGLGTCYFKHDNKQSGSIKNRKFINWATTNFSKKKTCDSWWGLGIFLFTTTSRTALGPTKPPIQWVPGALSLGVKQLRHEADHSPPSSAEVENVWSYTSTPQCVFIAWCLVKHRDNFTFIDAAYKMLSFQQSFPIPHQ
jgi:hypothetical protein